MRLWTSRSAAGSIFFNFRLTNIAEEQEILAGDIFDPEELDEMREDMGDEELQNMITFEASWRTPAQISKRYFGDRIDSLDTNTIKLTRYKKV
jgi:hypothetical protein